MKKMAVKKKKPITNPVLKTWLGLNEEIIFYNEEQCIKLIYEEQDGRRRKQFLRRIHSRLNKVRADRERQELDK